MDPGRNNLGNSDSLYLRQHSGNPVNWQEWGPGIRQTAARFRKPIFVSVGYSSCHWCHVMAAEAFSDDITAEFLNEHFICVKVDREERPDIDHYLMEFLAERTGSGGWPLNAFLTWGMHPVHALTYAPAKPKWGIPTLLEVARQVNANLGSGSEVQPFRPSEMPGPAFEKELIIPWLARLFDSPHGGFGKGHKFPPHSTLLYMLYSLSESPDRTMETMAAKTLDSMMLGGLNDHLQGGIFRYCVDRQWEIPHFEKMLYDQAMALWAYSLAFRVLGNAHYRKMALKIMDGLESQFFRRGLYLNSLDADTNHAEGATYLWEPEEIESILGQDGFSRFSQAYNLPAGGNFEGQIHLTRTGHAPMDDLELKLLAARRKRPQPNADEKYLSGNNCLVVCAMVQASSHLEMPECLSKAGEVMREVLATFWDGKGLARVLSNGRVKRSSFLFDGASALLALTMLAEHDRSWVDAMNAMAAHVNSFKDGDGWLESMESDFHKVPAARQDQPIPSGVSMAEMAMARLALMSGNSPDPIAFAPPHSSDFHNIAGLISKRSCSLLSPTPDSRPYDE